MAVCRRCGRVNDHDALFCQDCGESLENRSMEQNEQADRKCAACGASNPEGTRFCRMCGVRLTEWEPESSEGHERKPCPVCGKPTPTGFAFCQFCGCRIGHREPGSDHHVEPTPPAGLPRPVTAPMEVVAPPPAWDKKHSMQTSGEVGEPSDGLRTQEMSPTQAEALHKLVEESTDPEQDVSPDRTAELHFTGAVPKPEPGLPRLVEVTGDGGGGREWEVEELPFDVGRTSGQLILEDDPYLCERHARILESERGFQVRDVSALNGVFVKVSEPEPIIDGDLILIGDTLLRFEAVDPQAETLEPAVEQGVRYFGTPQRSPWARLRVLTEAGTGREVFYLFGDRAELGGGPADVSLLADGGLAPAHASLRLDEDRYLLEDLGSSSGTFLKVRGARVLRSGDVLRIGRRVLRFEVGSR